MQRSHSSIHLSSKLDQEQYFWEMQKRNYCYKPGNRTATFEGFNVFPLTKRFNCKRKRSLRLSYRNLWSTLKLTLNLIIHLMQKSSNLLLLPLLLPILTIMFKLNWFQFQRKLQLKSFLQRGNSNYQYHLLSGIADLTIQSTQSKTLSLPNSILPINLNHQKPPLRPTPLMPFHSPVPIPPRLQPATIPLSLPLFLLPSNLPLLKIPTLTTRSVEDYRTLNHRNPTLLLLLHKLLRLRYH